MLFYNARFMLYFSYSEVFGMGLFRKKKQNKAVATAEKIEPTLIIEASDNQPEALKREILPTFITFLRDITRLEESTQRKSQTLEREKLEDGLSDFARTPEIEKLWVQYHEQFEKLAVPLCSPKLLQRGYAETFATPARFHYINNGCRLSVAFPDEHTIEIIAKDFSKLQQKDRFILRNIENKWLIDEVYYTYPNSERWYMDSI